MMPVLKRSYNTGFAKNNRIFSEKGYKFTTVANLLGMKKDQVMPPVPKTKGYYIFQVTSAIAIGGYYLGYLFFAMFIVLWCWVHFALYG